MNRKHTTPSQRPTWHGVFTALVTPFDASRNIDWQALDTLLVSQRRAGVAGIVVLGTTGEAATLTETECQALVRHVLNRVGDAMVVVVGTGANDTAQAVHKAILAEQWGAHALLVVTPYYNRPSQEGLKAHYTAIAQASALPIMLYNVPGRCGVDLLPQTVGALALACPNIIGIKEASGQTGRVSELRQATHEGFAIHCGDDELAPGFYAHGAVGLTSVLSNLDPAICMAIHAASVQNDWPRLRQMHETALPLIKALFCDSSPGPVKHLLASRLSMHAAMRLPLIEPTPDTGSHIDATWAGYLQRRAALSIAPL